MGIKHHNYDYDGGSPNIPEAVGDRYYAQDLGRDYWSAIDRSGWVLSESYEDFPALFKRGDVTKGTLFTDINISANQGVCEYDVSVPNSYAALPPTVTTETIRAIVECPDITDLSISGTATLDGVTVNYVKMQYDESNGASRARVKKAGSYVYEKEPSYAIVVDAVSPTNSDIVLAELVGNGTSTMTVTNREKTPPKSDIVREKITIQESVSAGDAVGICNGSYFKAKMKITSFAPSGTAGQYAHAIVHLYNNYIMSAYTLVGNGAVYISIHQVNIDGSITNIITDYLALTANSVVQQLDCIKLSAQGDFLISYSESVSAYPAVRAFNFNGTVITSASAQSVVTTSAASPVLSNWNGDLFVVMIPTGFRIGEYVSGTIVYRNTFTTAIANRSVLDAVCIGPESKGMFILNSDDTTAATLPRSLYLHRGQAVLNGTWSVTMEWDAFQYASGSGITTKRSLYLCPDSAGAQFGVVWKEQKSGSNVRTYLRRHFRDSGDVKTQGWLHPYDEAEVVNVNPEYNTAITFPIRNLQVTRRNNYGPGLYFGVQYTTTATDQRIYIAISGKSQRQPYTLQNIPIVDNRVVGSSSTAVEAFQDINGAIYIIAARDSAAPQYSTIYVCFLPIFYGVALEAGIQGDEIQVAIRGSVGGQSNLVPGSHYRVDYETGALIESVEEDAIGRASTDKKILI